MDAHTNTHNNHIDTNSSHDIFLSIRALDAGISNHEYWISKVHQSLICKNIHPNPDDLLDDAHCRCKFGKWLYGPEAEVLKDNEIYRIV